MDNLGLNSYSKLILAIIAALRKITLYPALHPAVVNSVKDIYLTLSEILKNKNMLTLSLSAENKLIIENEPVNEKSLNADDLIAHFKKLNVESITFDSGITEKEIDDFLRFILLKPDEIKESGEINKILTDKNIQHIKTNQFSYIKIDKDSVPVVVKKGASDLEPLKSSIKNISSGKIQSLEETQNIEKQIFEIISLEFKDKNKISPPVKNLFKRYLLHCKDQESILLKLKNALLAAGFTVEDVENLIDNIVKEKIKKTEPKEDAFSNEEIERLKKENQDLRVKVNQLQQVADIKASTMQEMEKQSRNIIVEKQRLDNVIHNMSEGLVVVDNNGNIVMVNPIAEKLLNITKEDIGKPIKEVVKDEHLLTLVKKIPSDKDEAVEKDIELYSSSDSTKRTLRASSAVIEDPNGKTLGMVTTLNDITKQREIEKLKSEFLSNVSHELRTPLVAIEKSVFLILSKTTGEITDTQQQFLSIAERNLKRLTLLINDLLDLSKLEAGKMTIKREPSEIGKVINDSAEVLNNWAKTKLIDIRLKIQPDLPQINIDPNRIVQVLNNLIGNAVKFTPNNGAITIEACLQKESEAIQVSVTDTGIGIAQENLVKLFDKFYQIGERVSTDISGTGLGLSISKEIVELHGGKVWAESQQGSGAKFIFTLPLKDNTLTGIGENHG